ncbi:unnamed protein product [Kluyveromyces dobzhanskii CBS 2104]|uniref:WGS project CCBQ000000000 data, contig 00015 n=1 Tax=Kluyveromyces dobzhanskii CBS 2104 TaxID=1427455 RepID=A0A0A8LCJ1_9SACH|nr:unnamed protein product [Kluyveromyces dobzhanskii CBS 2104]
MSLPIELIDRVVTSGLDSLESVLAWSKVGSHFRTVVREGLGVLKIWDSDRGSFRASPAPWDCDMLSDDKNTVNVYTDSFKFCDVSEFLTKFDNLLIVIVSYRCYSDPLATTLCELSKGLNDIGVLKNLCFIYKTHTNFLSKFYFRELSHCTHVLRLCELYVVANSNISCKEVDMFDIDTIFDTTYLHNLEVLYTLNIRKGKKVIAPRLLTIKQLHCADNDKIVNHLRGCPRLSTIEQFQVPPGSRAVLPPCDHLTLVSFNTNTERDLIDGSFVRESLTIKMSPMCSEPIFKNIKCCNIRTLSLEFNNKVFGGSKFVDCFFGNLRSYRCPQNTDWDDLVNAKSYYIDSIDFKISDILSLQNFAQIPFTMNRLILSSTTRELRLAEDTISQFRTTSGCSQVIRDSARIEVDLSSVWDCTVFHHLVIPHLTSDSQLFLTINQTTIASELEKTGTSDPSGNLLNKLQLDCCNNRIRLSIPKVKAFEVSFLKECTNDKHEASFQAPLAAQLPLGSVALLHPFIIAGRVTSEGSLEQDVIEFVNANA